MKRPRLEKDLRKHFPFGFHLSKESWDQFKVDSIIDSTRAAKVGFNILRFRSLADRMNEKRFRSSRVLEPVQAGQLVSAGIIVTILRYIFKKYAQEQISGVIGEAFDWVSANRGENLVSQPPPSFVKLFPPQKVAAGEESISEFLDYSEEAENNLETVFGEMILLYLSMENPAFRKFNELFDDEELRHKSPYVPLVRSLEEFLDTKPVFELTGEPLLACLRAPMKADLNSLQGQLDYIKQNWAKFLPPDLLEELLLVTDILQEEKRMRGLGPGETKALEFGRYAYGEDFSYPEPERFSRDADWMSNVILIAKSVYVWLDQLSKKYKREIRHLNDIPDEELDRLANWGFTGLWLIGLWERSPASQKIKQMMGNSEAVASAYSLYDYTIAEDLGGESSYRNLKERAWQRGLRLASDMVPNHTGIYSQWVIEHPDWFIQLRYPPYPCYQYTGEDLSRHPRICIQIEDGYWDRRDAAVVFKRIDKETGDTRYIYHGNDGTSMPWNDTAQLNFLIPEVREAVIQTILHVARKFPIIRFDAAMTLAKKHYQRLWFPKLGDGGAIPSRAEHGLSKQEFDKLFPIEFWREVVDRVAAEAPDTLLLAEAFWLMEGYFVRTLGMHRVYNSAFMNMLKMEDNAKYRTTVKNVLEFSPQVLKRFVNFMNNPDEETAVAQFGKGDKYFGAAVMMATMPGLPMFGHGQVEGFTEKYGMEYRRAYWDEHVDEDMVRRHESDIFPIMKRRWLFSGAENFAFFDFMSDDGYVDENVFAYSNRVGGQRAIVLYNNAYNSTSGSIHTSTAINVGSADEPKPVRKGLTEALELNNAPNVYYIFREYRTKLEFIRNGKQLAEQGLHAALRGYDYQIFLDFREVYDSDGSWGKLAYILGGAGVPDINARYREMQMEPILHPFQQCIEPDILKGIAEADKKTQSNLTHLLQRFYQAASDYASSEEDMHKLAIQTSKMLSKIPLKENVAEFDNILASRISEFLSQENEVPYDCAIAIRFIVSPLGEIKSKNDDSLPEKIMRNRMKDWFLEKHITESLSNLYGSADAAGSDSALIALLVSNSHLQGLIRGTSFMDSVQIFDDPDLRSYLNVNRYEGEAYFNKERLERMVKMLFYLEAVKLLVDDNQLNISVVLENARFILKSAQESGYKLDKFTALLSELER